MAIEHRFIIGHREWKILEKHQNHLLYFSFFTETWPSPEVFYSVSVAVLAFCCSCWELACREGEQPKCLLLICGLRQLLPVGAGAWSAGGDSHCVYVSHSYFSNRHTFRPCLILILKRKESWASIVETLSKSLTILTPTGGRERAVDRRACSHATTWPQWTGTSRDKY